MSKFNMGLSNYFLNKKINSYLTIKNYTTPDDSKTKFRIERGLASYDKTIISQLDDELDKHIVVYALDETVKPYVKLIQHKIVSKAEELCFKITRYDNTIK